MRGLSVQLKWSLLLAKWEVTNNFKKKYGRSFDEDFNYPDLFQAIVPEYRNEIKKLVDLAVKNHTIYQAEYQVKWPDDSIHWISAHGKARYEESGVAKTIVGVTADIT